MNMRASVITTVVSKPDKLEVPTKSAMASAKKQRPSGRHISFAPFPTFVSPVEIRPSSATVSSCSTKACLCAPTNHPGSFRCRLHRNNPMVRTPADFTNSSSRKHAKL